MGSIALLAAISVANAFMATQNRPPRVPVAAADMSCECAVIGAGPAGAVIAWLLAERGGLEVALIDPSIDRPWPNNYGVWQAEFEALDSMMPELKLKDCVDHTWQTTDCFFETDEKRTTLDRAYCRVHRGRLQTTLRTRSDAAGVRRIQAKVRGDAASWCANIVDGIRHDAAGSTLNFDDGRTLRATSVVDCTGFESSLTSRQGTGAGPPPTFQVAYGIYGLVEEASLAPYHNDAMLLFDYRDDHLPVKERDASPSFMYAMPLDLDESTGLRTVVRGVIIRLYHVATSMASLLPHRSSSRRPPWSRAQGCP